MKKLKLEIQVDPSAAQEGGELEDKVMALLRTGGARLLVSADDGPAEEMVAEHAVSSHGESYFHRTDPSQDRHTAHLRGHVHKATSLTLVRA